MQKVLRRTLRGVLKSSYKIAFSLLGLLLPVNRKLMVFESFLGKQYSCNPRALYEYLQHQGSDFALIWSVDRRHLRVFEDNQIPHVVRFSLRWTYLMATAHFWVSNARMPDWIPRPRHTTYVQTWHGTPLKQLGGDIEQIHMPNTETNKYRQEFYREAQNWTYLISPNAYSTDIFRRAFRFESQVLEVGYPRNDYLYNCNTTDDIAEIRHKYGLPEEKKVILYAPTFRDNQFTSHGQYQFKLELDLRMLEAKLGQDYVVILRLHYLIAQSLNISESSGFVLDLSTAEDIRELMLISDILVTDYSSVMFDYANLKRPMIFFVYDIEEYRDTLRGFYFDFEQSAPGPLVKTTADVVRSIRWLEQHNWQLGEKFVDFYNQFCYLECGDSAHRVWQHILSEHTV